MIHKWIYRPEPDEEVVDALSTSLGFGTFESKILVMRGIDNYQKAREFFKPKLEDIHNPFLMADMQRAVERIATAIENGEKILVYGDYDVDGTTAVALMYLYLSKIVDKKFLDFYIPDRRYGCGLHPYLRFGLFQIESVYRKLFLLVSGFTTRDKTKSTTEQESRRKCRSWEGGTLKQMHKRCSPTSASKKTCITN